MGDLALVLSLSLSLSLSFSLATSSRHVGQYNEEWAILARVSSWSPSAGVGLAETQKNYNVGHRGSQIIISNRLARSESDLKFVVAYLSIHFLHLFSGVGWRWQPS